MKCCYIVETRHLVVAGLFTFILLATHVDFCTWITLRLFYAHTEPVPPYLVHIQDSDLPKWKSVLDDQRQRKLRLQKACENFRIDDRIRDSAWEDYSHLVADDTHRLVFCHIPKVGSTVWLRSLAKLIGKVSPEGMEKLATTQGFERNPSSYVHDWSFKADAGLSPLCLMNPDEMTERLVKYYKFMYVRNPLERILSAFQDKFTNHDSATKPWTRGIGDIIRTRYRKRPFNTSDVTFEEFLSYIADEAEHGRRAESHWAPFHKICYPCDVQYDFIGKFETYHRDADYIFQYIMNISSDSRTLMVDQTKGPHSSAHSNETAHSRLKRYYGSIPTELFERIKAAYLIDSVMFDYDLDVL